ncbi:MAG TPA: phosphopantetheine-binding protein [Chitinophagaceae bacterium]|nr:phosphopantetheine-binding protein [Chitinophagaceae bacterium]
MDEILPKLKIQIIEALNLDIKPEEFDNDMPLFGTGLGLDSIDALELVVILDKHYKIKITDSEQAKRIFVSVRTLAEFIKSQKK